MANFPSRMVQPNQGFTTVTIQFKPFGVRLDFTGTISADNVIRLHVAPEVSTLDFSNGLTISGFNIPAISTRRAETEIELKDGQSFGIAGLMDHRAQVQLSKVPGIADVPVLGQLFRSRLDQSQQYRTAGAGNTAYCRSGSHPDDGHRQSRQPIIPYIDNPKFDNKSAGSREEADVQHTEFEMSAMTAKNPLKDPSRENLPPGEPLSVVSICLDRGNLGNFEDCSPTPPPWCGWTGIWQSTG